MTMRSIRSTTSYKEFSAKRKQWRQILRGKDRNTVFNQIGRMLWDAAAYRVVNEARALAPPAKDGGVQLNGIMHRLIDDCFSASQFVAVRRILDPSPAGPKGNKGVFSLRWLLNDMQKHVHLITRENVFAAERLKYDVGAIRQKRLAYGLARRRAGGKAYEVPAELRTFFSERRHETIDRLAGVQPSARAKTDTVRPDVFNFLIEKVDQASRKMNHVVDKLIAHAATPFSRKATNVLRLKTTLGELWEAHRAVCQVANFLSVHVLGDSNYGGLAVPQWDQFAYLDRPLVTADKMDRLRKVWDEYERETHDWANWTLDHLVAERTTTMRKAPRGGS